MVDFDRLITRFRQFGGWRLVWQYVRMGVLWTGVCALVRCALKGKSLKAAYPVMTEKVDRILIRKYRYILDDMKVRDAEDLTLMMGAFRRLSGSPGCRVSIRLLIW